MKTNFFNVGFLYLGKLNIGKNQKKIYNINNNELLGYINDDLNYNKNTWQQILQESQNAFKKHQFDNVNLRIEKLNKFCDLLSNEIETLSYIMCNEIGKKYSDCVQEIKRSIIYTKDTIDFYVKHYQKPVIIDDNNITHVNNKKGIFTRVGLGVVLGIIPFNFPINLLITKLVPAYLMSNSIIIKMSKNALLTSSYLSKIFYEAGFDDNLVQFVNIKANYDLYKNKFVKMINFTGSSEVGNKIANKVHKIPLILEMGGKDACLICDDANFELATSKIIDGAFKYNGQRCTAIKRVFVSKLKHSLLVKLLTQKIKNLSVGNSIDNCDITPLINNDAVENIKRLVVDAKNKNAILIPNFEIKNNIVKPCLIDNVNESMNLYYEEQFGPILPIIVYDTISDAINKINDSKYGLQASVFCNSENDFFEIAKNIEVGTVNWNSYSSRSPDIFPFLGIKDSGFGVQGIKESLESMSQIKGYVINKK